MNIDTFINSTHSAVMSDRDFSGLSEFIQKELGIMMPQSKKSMLEARLRKRLRVLGLQSFDQYCNYVFTPHGIENELLHMIDLVTTNKTDFFREAAHFDYLVQEAVPELIKLNGAGIKKTLMVWSAGCSTGEEPYTLAMVLQDFADRRMVSGFDFQVLATDISTKVLHAAESGIYDSERVAPVPMEFRKKFLLRSRDPNRGVVRIVQDLRNAVRFRRLNFKEGEFDFREKLDVIFCRNVTIYFDRYFQEDLLNRFYRQMVSGGYLFTGHSETLNGLNVPFVRVHPAVYRKPVKS
jgi:chemotaxis protein methyltransferase CheR